MEEDLAIFFAPDEAHGKAPPQFAARCLVANATQQAGAQHVQFGLAHRALETEQQTVIEHGRMIEAVGIANERIGEAAEIEQAIPVGVIAGKA